MSSTRKEWLKRPDKLREELLKQRELENIIQLSIVRQILGDDFRAVYFCPYFSPSGFLPRKIGEWTYVDIEDLSRRPEVFAEANPRSRLVQLDLRKLEYPPELPRGGFDLAFLNRDYAGRGSSYFAVNHCLRIGGLTFLHNLLNLDSARDHLEEIIAQHPNHRVIYNPPYPSHTVLMKTHEDRAAERRYVAWLEQDLQKVEGDWETAAAFKFSKNTAKNFAD